MSVQKPLVLITGASSGIGRATAERFLKLGARVIATGRRMEPLEELGATWSYSVDVTDGPGMQKFTDTILQSPGCPDIVVANAGIGADALFAETDDAMFEASLQTNVMGVVRTLRPFVKPMIERGSGRLLIVSSVVGKRGVPFYSAYSASKFALHGLADALRVELRGTGVTVGLVCPSSTESDFDQRKLRQGPRQPGKRVQQHSADSVAQAIVKMAGSTRREVVLSAEGKMMAWLNCWLPGLLDRILYRALMRSKGDDK